ncbi:MAG: hypothetical protein WCH34_10850 [Bacteroidota bacterium]
MKNVNKSNIFKAWQLVFLIIFLLIFTISCISNKYIPNQKAIIGKYRIICVILGTEKVPNLVFLDTIQSNKYLFLDTVPPFILTFNIPKIHKNQMKGIISLTADTIDRKSGYYCNAQNSIRYALNNNDNTIQMYWNAWHSDEALNIPPFFSLLRKSLNIVDGTIKYNNDSLIIYNYLDKEKTKIFTTLKAIRLK